MSTKPHKRKANHAPTPPKQAKASGARKQVPSPSSGKGQRTSVADHAKGKAGQAPASSQRSTIADFAKGARPKSARAKRPKPDHPLPLPKEPIQETIEITGWTNGGEGVGRLTSGQVVFVPDTIPGETVTIEVTQLKKSFARGAVHRIEAASPHRVTPPCTHYATCGGCQLQHITPGHQAVLKTQTIREQLERLAKIDNPPVQPTRTPAQWPLRYRNHGRFAVTPDGTPGFSQRQTNTVAAIPDCLVLTEDVLDLYAQVGRDWAGIKGMELFTGDTPADRYCVVYPGDGGVPPAPDAPFGYALQTVGDPAIMREPDAITVTITPATAEPYALQVSPGAFFQSGPSPAALLVDTVLELANVQPGDTVLDLYSGVGLLTIPLARAAGDTGHVTAVELSSVATDNAVVNAQGLGLPITIVHDDTLHWLEGVDLMEGTIAILDPPRAGAGPEVCALLSEYGVERIVLVSCEIGAMTRDVKTLIDLGYTLETSIGLDLFAHTLHIECISLLTRRP